LVYFYHPDLPGSLWQAPNLRQLFISSSGLGSLPEVEDGVPPMLKDIYIYDTGESSQTDNTKSFRLPETLGLLTSLENLDISSTNLKYIPQSLGYLMNLHTLKIQYSGDSVRIPATIGELNNLHTVS